jgi:sulfopyruvate decarboxylase subunit alpha
MTWAHTIVDTLKLADISLIAYVPDISIHQATSLMVDDPDFHVVPCTREEEAIGIAVGAYAAGRRSAVFMQSSGLGNCINAITSLCIPCRIPIPLFINMRGDLGEFNIAQVAMGRATKPLLDILRLPHYTLTEQRELDTIVKGALNLCYASREPVAICMTSLLHRGQLA